MRVSIAHSAQNVPITANFPRIRAQNNDMTAGGAFGTGLGEFYDMFSGSFAVSR
jgi:hypothetical protein